MVMEGEKAGARDDKTGWEGHGREEDDEQEEDETEEHEEEMMEQVLVEERQRARRAS